MQLEKNLFLNIYRIVWVKTSFKRNSVVIETISRGSKTLTQIPLIFPTLQKPPHIGLDISYGISTCFKTKNSFNPFILCSFKMWGFGLASCAIFIKHLLRVVKVI